MRILIAGGIASVLLSGCGGILPHESNVDSARFQTYEQVMLSYDGVKLGTTRLNDLRALGFDTRTTPNIEVLSYTEIVDRFLPAIPMKVENAPAGVRQCIESHDRCSAYVIRLQHSHKQRSGGVVPDLMGIERDTVEDGWSAEVVLLVQDDTVVYKVMSGFPHLQQHNTATRPLGPLQDLSKGVGNENGTDQPSSE